MLTTLLFLLVGLSALARADWTIIDAGSSATFNGVAGASTTTWLMNGQTISTNPGFTWSPAVNQVGTHWLQCEQAFPDGTKSTTEWGLRVRIPMQAASLQLYVSPTGSDANPGSIGAPFLTLEKARDTIRTLPRPLPAGGVTVYLRGGIHRRTTSFALGAQDSGDSLTAPIVYAGYPGETSILSNGRALNSADFAPLAASEHARVAPGIDPARIWEVDLSTFTRTSTYPAAFNAWRSWDNSGYGSNLLDVYFNNSRAWMSRYPNTSDDEKTTHNQTLEMNGVVLSPDGVTYLNRQGTYVDSGGASVAVGGAFYYDAADAAHVERWQSALSNGGAWIQGHWNNSWTINSLKVQLIDPGKKVIAIDSSINSSKFQTGLGNKYTRDASGNGPGSYNEPWWVLNLLEEMDVTGEWCIDFSRNKLYFLAPDTTPPADGAVVIADTVTPIASLTGSHVRLQNLTFQESLGTSLSLAGANNLVVACTFRNISRNAIELTGTMNGVVSCDLTELGGAGVMVLGGSVSPRSASGNFVVNNDISKFGRIGRVYFGGIHAGYKSTAVGARIAHNRVANTPHGGIFHGSFDSVFEYNEVKDFCLFSDDMGGFYSFPGVGESRGHIFRYNFIRDSGRNPLNSSLLGNAFYFDLAHEEMTLYGNVSHQTVRNSWYKHGNQIDSGVPQLVYNYNNLSIEDGAGFEFVAPKPTTTYPSKIENNATVGVGSPFKSQEVIVTNGVATSLGGMTGSAALLESTANSHKAYGSDIGFVNMANDDFRLNPTSSLYTDLPGFKPIPFELIGLYNDEYRSGIATRSPLVLNGAAAVSGTFAAISGSLAFPQFESDTTVKLYWGLTDGGSSPGSWANVIDLGVRSAGPLSANLTGLTPGTTYYFRFFASNSAGSHWAGGTGNTSASTGTALSPANSLLLHLDASAAATIIKDGSNKVSRWNDARGGSNYVAQETAAAQPIATTDSTLGKTVVDFGALVTNSTGKWMQIKNAAGNDRDLTTIKTVIAVMKGANHLLGDNDKYDFHRVDPASATSALWNNTYASANIRNGKTYLNGAATAINGTSTAMPATYWLASVVTNGSPVEASRLACDRTNRTGGQQICELLVYDTVLSDADRIATEDYLLKKWFNIGGPDTTPPVITAPANATVSASGSGGVAVTFTAQAIDNNDGFLTPTFSPPSGTVFSAGTTTVTVTATDAAGNTANKTFTITVTDNLGPIIDVPEDKVVEATGPGGSVVNFTTSAFDAVSGPRTTTSTPASGSIFPLGSSTVTTTATDAAGNTSRETFSITVRDTTVPMLTTPASLIADAAGPGGATVNFTTSATDLVSGAVATNDYPASGSNFPLGNTTVTTRATDASGNQASRNFTVTVADTSPPVIPVLPDLTAEATGPGGAAVSFTIPATDLVDSAPATSSNPASGSTFILGTTSVTATASDASGNTSTRNFTVTVRDTMPPEITVPANMTVETTDSNGAAVTYSSAATDLVSGSRPAVDVPVSGSNFALGTTTVTTTATDAAGNTGSKTFTVTVQYPLPAAPTGLSAATSSGQVQLEWQPVQFASSYRLKRTLTTGGPYTTVSTGTGTSFLDSGRANGLTYYYVVSAVNATGEGADSSQTIAVMPGGTFQKADNAIALGLSGSWTGNAVPSTGDTALWNGTYAAGNASVSIGSGISVNRIQFTSPSRAITLTAGSGPLTIRGVDVPGIDLSASTQSLTINAPVVLAASQAWTVASGRTLSLNEVVSDGDMARGLTFAGAGSIVLAANNTYTGTTALSAGTLHLGATTGSGTGSIAGPLSLSGGTLRSNRTDAHAPIAGLFSASAGVIHVNAANGVFTLNANNLPAGSSSVFTTLTGSAGASFVVDGAPTASLRFGGNVAGMNLTVKNSAVAFTTNGGAFNFRIEGGSFTSTPTDRFTLATANQTFTVTGGTVNLTAGAQYGFRFGGGGTPTQTGAQKVIGTQSGGSVSVSAFSMGGTDTDAVKSPSYTLSGGTLSTNGGMTIGADTGGNGSSTFTLSGSGKLKVPGAISGAQTGAKQIFTFSGGILAAGTITATNLRSADTAANGTFTQSGGTLAPGDVGVAGRTVITGAYQLGASGTLAIDIGGSTQATAYQTGQYDYLTVSTTTTLAGNLSVKLINGFTPSNASTFTILNSTGTLSGVFANVSSDSRVLTAGGEGTFLVTKSGNTVLLGGFVALTPQQGWLHQYFGTSENTGTAADTFDADSDGLPNLLEYALGTSPTSAASAAPPAIATATNYLVLTFNRIADPALVYRVETSPDLSDQSWSSFWQSTGAQNTAGPVTVTDSAYDINTSTPPRRFLRLRISAAP